ncbi:MAG: PIN domain-containing protein [Actinomycetota bacterium]
MGDKGTKRRRVLFDADALIAGSASATGASHALLVLSELDVLEVVISPHVLAEADRNLRAKLPKAVPLFRSLVEHACRGVEDPSPEILKTLMGQAHEKDLPVLGAAVQSDCESIITFNTKDFNPRGDRPRIETPGDFLVRLRNELEEELPP